LVLLEIERRRRKRWSCSIDDGCHNTGYEIPVTRRREAAPSALAWELDAGQPSRAGFRAALRAHSIDFEPFVVSIFMCTSSVLALEAS
jgi:hypothetical protein